MTGNGIVQAPSRALKHDLIELYIQSLRLNSNESVACRVKHGSIDCAIKHKWDLRSETSDFRDEGHHEETLIGWELRHDLLYMQYDCSKGSCVLLYPSFNVGDEGEICDSAIHNNIFRSGCHQVVHAVRCEVHVVVLNERLATIDIPIHDGVSGWGTETVSSPRANCDEPANETASVRISWESEGRKVKSTYTMRLLKATNTRKWGFILLQIFIFKIN